MNHESSPIQRQLLPAWGSDTIAILVVLAGTLLPGIALPGLLPFGGDRPGPRMPQPEPGLYLLTAFGVSAVAAALLPLRRRWPLQVFLGTLVLFVATLIGGVHFLGPAIAATIAAFGVANRTPRRTAFVTGGAATVFVVLLSLAVNQWSSVDARVFQVAAAIAVATALGDSTRSRREYLIAMTERAERAEQTREAEAHRRVAEERLRIARDLHDTVAHQISVISLNAGVASDALEARPERAREALGTIRTAARGVLADIGELLRYLRAEAGDGDAGADRAPVGEAGRGAVPPQPGLAGLAALVDRMRASGLEVEVRTEGDLDRVASAQGAVAYRVVQEGLTNAHKHGSGHSASVRLAATAARLVVEVENAVEPAAGNRAVETGSAPGGGLGLIGLRERVVAVGGTVDAGLAGSGRYRLAVTIPITPAAAPVPGGDPATGAAS